MNFALPAGVTSIRVVTASATQEFVARLSHPSFPLVVLYGAMGQLFAEADGSVELMQFLGRFPTEASAAAAAVGEKPLRLHVNCAGPIDVIVVAAAPPIAPPPLRTLWPVTVFTSGWTTVSFPYPEPLRFQLMYNGTAEFITFHLDDENSSGGYHWRHPSWFTLKLNGRRAFGIPAWMCRTNKKAGGGSYYRIPIELSIDFSLYSNIQLYVDFSFPSSSPPPPPPPPQSGRWHVGVMRHNVIECIDVDGTGVYTVLDHC